jgi:hypothetical protein
MNPDQAEELARILMDENDLTDWHVVIQSGPHGWAGHNWSGFTDDDTSSLLFHQEWIEEHDEAAVRECILHEMGHALVIDKQAHGLVWRKKALSLGCSRANVNRYRQPLAIELEAAIQGCRVKGWQLHRQADGLFDLKCQDDHRTMTKELHGLAFSDVMDAFIVGPDAVGVS